jgi:hypothetical protein
MNKLDGAKLKVIRAIQHLKFLDEEIERYLSSKPDSFPADRQGDMVTVGAAVREQPHPALSCIVGDCVTNLRASLDYIAWELAMLARKSLPDKDKKRITFPIASDYTGFTKPRGTAEHLKDCCGVPAAAIDVIESVQPYHAGYESLELLNLLVNEDKHRALLLCALDIRGLATVRITQGNKLWAKGGRIGIGTDFKASGPGLSKEASFAVNVESETTVLVAFQDARMPRVQVTLLLSQIVERIANIVPSFEPFFKD